MKSSKDKQPNATPAATSSLEMALAQPCLAQPCSVRCASIDAAVIYAVAHGEMSLRQKRDVATTPLEQSAANSPPVEKPEGPYEQRQPHRSQFDAADIYQLSKSTHPWQAGQIQKTAPIQKAG